MDLKKNIKHLLASPLFISVILSMVIYSLVPINIEQFKTQLTSRTANNSDFDSYFCDLDKDGYSERIDLYKRSKVSIIVSVNERVLDQWNFDEKFLGNLTWRNGITLADVDNDSISEIILVTYRKGKILLHGFNPITGNILFRDKEITTYSLVNDEINTGVRFADCYDYNHDGVKEIYCVLESGFSIQPRSIIAYDFKNDTILRSPEGCNLYFSPKANDIDLDGVPEFYAGSRAVGNCDPDDTYTDHHTWFMVFSPDMRLRFTPIKTGDYTSYFQVDQYALEGERLFAGLQVHQGTGNAPCYIALYDDKGRIEGKIEFEYTPAWRESFLLPQSIPDRISIMKAGGTILNYDAALNLVDSLAMHPVSGPPFEMDVDGDGIREFIFETSAKDKIILAQNDFSTVTEVNFPERVTDPNFSMKLVTGKPPELFVQSDDFSYTIVYYHNPLYPYRWLLFPMLFLVVLGFVSLLYQLQKTRLTQKFQAEKRLIELQLTTIRNQLDPHFTLNLMASIGDLFNKKDEKTRQYVFSKYIALLRHSIVSADQFAVALDSELKFVKDYLALEKFRFDNRLDFEITMDGIDNEIKVPKMLVHSFVENGVKHGIRHRGAGRIEVCVRRNGKTCLVAVRDNGIGREKSQEIASFSSGKGLSIVDRIIEQYNYLAKTKIRYQINDLKDSGGNALGTEIIINIPI